MEPKGLGSVTSAIRHFIGHEEERNPPRLGRGDTRGSTEMPDHFLFRGRIKVIRSPVKRKDLGASPSLGATL